MGTTNEAVQGVGGFAVGAFSGKIGSMTDEDKAVSRWLVVFETAREEDVEIEMVEARSAFEALVLLGIHERIEVGEFVYVAPYETVEKFSGRQFAKQGPS